MISKDFDKQILLDLGLPYEAYDDAEIISDKIVGKNRWAIIHELIFRMPNQEPNTAWLTKYYKSATEYQDQQPWDDNIVKAILVHQVEEIVKVWKPLE